MLEEAMCVLFFLNYPGRARCTVYPCSVALFGIFYRMGPMDLFGSFRTEAIHVGNFESKRTRRRARFFWMGTSFDPSACPGWSYDFTPQGALYVNEVTTSIPLMREPNPNTCTHNRRTDEVRPRTSFSGVASVTVHGSLHPMRSTTCVGMGHRLHGFEPEKTWKGRM